MSNAIDSADRFGFLEVRSERDADRHVIALAGELDVNGIERVTCELRRAEASDARQIVLDLTGLTFIDSSGVCMIVEAHARSQADGDRLVLTCAPGAVQRIFDLTSLTDHLPFTS
jgi:anti-sigma B factor antagonist